MDNSLELFDRFSWCETRSPTVGQLDAAAKEDKVKDRESLY